MKLKMFLFSLLLVLLSGMTTYAATTITNYEAVVQINSDGSADVIETIEYDINEKINGQYRTIDYRNSSDADYSADDIKDFSIEVDGITCKEVAIAFNGEENVYTVTDNGITLSIKLYMPTDHDSRKVIYRYTLLNVINQYDDVAEFYWNFVSADWEYPISNADIVISIPEEVENIQDLRVWGHGALWGESKVLDSKTVKLNIEDSEGSWIAARVTFPASMIVPNYLKYIKGEKLQNIIEEETVLANEANIQRKESRTKVMYAMLGKIALISVMITVPLYYYVKYDKELKPQFRGKYYRELPTDCTPAIMSYLMKPEKIGTQNILATLLDLSRRGYVEIEEISEGKDFKMSLIKEDLSELKDHERYFITDLIFRSEEEITIKDIENSNRYESDARYFSECYTKWIDKVKENAEEYEYIDSHAESKIASSLILIWAGIFIMIGFVTLFYSVIGIPFTIEGSVLWVMSDRKKRTRFGIEEYAKWKAFKRFLLDFSNMKDYNIPSMVVWEHYLVYATALGIAKKVIKNLKVYLNSHPDIESDYLTNYTRDMWMYSDASKFNKAVNSFSSPIAVARKTIRQAESSDSSGSGFGGGFSGGGGGGGFSGGGGGGSHGSF